MAMDDLNNEAQQTSTSNADVSTGEVRDDSTRNMAAESVEFLTGQRHGTLLADYGEALRDLAIAVRETGKAGSLALTVKIKPAGRNSGPSIVIEDAIKLNAPKPDVAETVMFIQEGGRLTRRDPRQPALDGFTTD